MHVRLLQMPLVGVRTHNLAPRGLLQGAESWGLLFVLWARPPFCVSSFLGEALHRLEIQSVCVVNFYLLFLFSTFFPTD